MSTACLVCDGHVATGEALLVLQGSLADGKFTSEKPPKGLVHIECLDQADAIDLRRGPVTFSL